MSHRFFSAAPITTDRTTLDGPEAHHLLHVMRAAIGDPVTLFDNNGAEFSSIIEKLGRTQVELRVIERVDANRELPFPLTVGVALPKGDRQKWLVEKLTELGVTTLVPLETARGVAQPTESARDRLERAVIEASKQCGRNRLMQISTPQAWDKWISQIQPTLAGGPRPPVTRLLAQPNATSISNITIPLPCPVHLAIGPEGGLTDAELATAIIDGWQTISLGPRILRVETAAIALTAAVTLNTT